MVERSISASLTLVVKLSLMGYQEKYSRVRICTGRGIEEIEGSGLRRQRFKYEEKILLNRPCRGLEHIPWEQRRNASAAQPCFLVQKYKSQKNNLAIGLIILKNFFIPGLS